MISPQHVLELADRRVETNNRWAAYPSTDVMMRGLTEGLAAAVNAELSQFFIGALTVLTFAHGDADPAAFNYAVAELAKTLGIQPPVAAPPSSGNAP